MKNKKKIRLTLCPVCGEKSVKTDLTKDGRVIRSCGDATKEKP